MKKILIFFGIVYLPFMMIFTIIVGFVGGGTTSVSAPIEPPATLKKVEEYAYRCSELGVPYDLVLITDYIYQTRKGKNTLEDRNPTLTALEFMQIKERIEEYKKVGEDEEGNDIYQWITIVNKNHRGIKEIAKFLNYKRDNLIDITASQLITLVVQKDKAMEIAKGKNFRVDIVLEPSQDYNFVLKNIVKVNDDDIKKILDLHNAEYIPELYSVEINKNIPIFDPTDLKDLSSSLTGTRSDIVRVASMIINHPYYWSGKFLGKGIPTNALDCSGYIDWVYYQVFGSGLKYGKIPSTVKGYGTAYMYYGCDPIESYELKPGDLGFYYLPEQVTGKKVNHVGIYIGNNMFIHCGGNWFGTKDLPNGRVGISVNDGKTTNFQNPFSNIHHVQPMKPSQFKYFARPKFNFNDDN